MVDQIAIVTFTTPASPGTIDVTHPDITEAFSGALFFWTGTTTDDADNDHLLAGIGCCVNNPSQSGDVNRGFCAQGNNNALTAQDYNTDAAMGDAAGNAIIACDPTNAATETCVGVFSSAIAGGVRLNFTTTTVQVKVTAILFAGATEAACGQAGGAAGSGSEVVGVAPGFEPDVIVQLGSKSGAINSNTVHALMPIGFYVNDGSDAQVSAYSRWKDQPEPSASIGRVDTTHAASTFSATSSTLHSFTATSTGFDWTRSGTAASVSFGYFAIKFSSPKTRFGVIASSIAASTGVQQFTGFGFTPTYVLGMSTLMGADSDTTGNTAAACGLFALAKDYERAITVHGEDGLTTVPAASFNCHHRSEDVGLLTYDGAGSISHRAAGLGFIHDGFSLDFSSAADTGYLIAIGFQLDQAPAPSAGGRAREAKQGTARHRRIVLGGRAARSNPWREWLPGLIRSRARAARRAGARVLQALHIPMVLDLDGSETLGDNALAGSTKGGNAMAGSEQGDNE